MQEKQGFKFPGAHCHKSHEFKNTPDNSNVWNATMHSGPELLEVMCEQHALTSTLITCVSFHI
jgi:hypothetical protein